MAPAQGTDNSFNRRANDLKSIPLTVAEWTLILQALHAYKHNAVFAAVHDRIFAQLHNI